jgi:catechol 2,3-dioxygenase-like lactoylglutathione lyase family enzyme
MWGTPPFSIADNCAVEVRNLAAGRKWYEEKLGFREALKDRQEDSGRPFVDLYISNDDIFLSLVELEPGASIEKRHIIFFTKDLEKAHQWLKGRGVAVEPTTTDSSGNRLFRFQDREGNNLEVCIEPG